MSAATLPRGLRCCNPGNIEHGAKWDGLADEQPDPRFASFTDLEHGYRAIARILRGYGKRGIVTPAEIARTWAPPNENDSGAYASVLADFCKVGAGDRLDLNDSRTLQRLCAAITFVECLAGAIARGVQLERA